MSKTRDTGYLANVIQVHDTGVRIMSGSEMLMAISSSGAVTITGELSGSDAANSLLLNGTGSVGFTTTGSFSTASGSASSRLTQIENVYATTGSNSFRATQSITGSLTVTGQIIAQTINVQQVTSSIVYSSGSNVFGCDINSRQTFTGSFYQTGSVSAFYSCVGIGTNFPTKALEIFSNVSQDGIKISGASNPRLTIIDTTNSVQFDALTTDTEAVLRTDTNHPLHLSTNGTLRLNITNTGIACFSCQVCANAFIASSGIRANNGSITSCNGTIGGAAVFIADAPDNTSDIGYRVHTGGSLKWFIGLPNNVVNDNFSIFQGGCSADRLTIDTVGNVGIGISSPVTTNLNGALTIWKCYNNDGASVPSTTAQTYYSNQHGLYLFGRNSGLSIISANSEEGSIKFGNASTNAYATIGTTTGTSSIGGDMYFRVGSDTERLRIFSTGVSCFACQVCTPQLVVCKAYSANNLMLSVANSNLSVPFVTYDTAIIQADDVTTLKIIERNGGASDNQVLTLSTGDNSTRISTSGINPLQFFVGGSSAGCGYNGLGGKNALSIACSGISTFSYPVNIGSIGHYTNYISTSGCFAIFCASQGAILYVTSMHNNGRATYQLIYSNGPTGGASISVVGSTSAYGPASTSFGLCANGWVYGYQQYGGPTDFYAIAMNSNFVWAF